VGLSQRDLAARSGLRPDRLSKYEAATHPPTLYALEKIGAALGVPPDLLMPEPTSLPLETDREFHRLCRKIWFYPPTVRATCVQVLRGLCEIYDRAAATMARSNPAGGRHASRG
jgi:transcriptional regulator with XRE-family HTH domain